MSQDAIFAAQEGLSVAAFLFAAAFLRVAHRANDRAQAAKAEASRERGWGHYWRKHADRLEAELAQMKSAASRRGSHARRCQITQQRDRLAATTAALRTTTREGRA